MFAQDSSCWISEIKHCHYVGRHQGHFSSLETIRRSSTGELLLLGRCLLRLEVYKSRSGKAVSHDDTPHKHCWPLAMALYFFISSPHHRRVLRAPSASSLEGSTKNRTLWVTENSSMLWSARLRIVVMFPWQKFRPKCPRHWCRKTKFDCSEFTSRRNVAQAFINISKLAHYDWMFGSH